MDGWKEGEGEDGQSATAPRVARQRLRGERTRKFMDKSGTGRHWQTEILTAIKTFSTRGKQKLIWPRITKTTQEFGKVSFDFPYTLAALASLKKNSSIWNGLSLRRNSEPNCGSVAVVFDGFTTADLATQIFALEELEDGWEQRKRGPRRGQTEFCSTTDLHLSTIEQHEHDVQRPAPI